MIDTTNFQAEFLKLVEDDVESSLMLITGMFVGLTLEFAKRNGHETDKEIKIDGGLRSRDITIHAPKK